jgi:nucleoid DNA-binding protein
MREFKGLPGIEEFLASQGDGCPVEVPEVQHIADALVAFTNLTKEQAQRILALFFQEIRSAMLNGEVVDIRGLGSFLVSSPSTTSNAKKVFAKFQPKRSLVKRLNHDRM